MVAEVAAKPHGKRRERDTPTSMRIAPGLLDKVKADAAERGTYTTTLINFIIAKYYNDTDEMLRAGCAKPGEIKGKK